MRRTVSQTRRAETAAAERNHRSDTGIGVALMLLLLDELKLLGYARVASWLIGLTVACLMQLKMFGSADADIGCFLRKSAKTAIDQISTLTL
jgi:hypothetical protein